MADPSEIGDYNEVNRKGAEKQEKKLTRIEHGSDIPPDSARPSYLFKDREDSIPRVLS